MSSTESTRLPPQRGHESGIPPTPHPRLAPGVVDTNVPEKIEMNAPIDNQVTLFRHLLEISCPISNQPGTPPSALVIVNHSQNMLIVNANAELRCSATLQCKLSISTVNHPIAPCQMIRTTVKVEANLTSLPGSSFLLSRYQFSRTRGPRNAPARNLWDHSVKIWNVEYRCPEPRESTSS